MLPYRARPWRSQLGGIEPLGGGVVVDRPQQRWLTVLLSLAVMLPLTLAVSLADLLFLTLAVSLSILLSLTLAVSLAILLPLTLAVSLAALLSLTMGLSLVNGLIIGRCCGFPVCSSRRLRCRCH